MTSDAARRWRRCPALCVAAIIGFGATFVACSEQGGSAGTGRLAGQVVVSGPLRKAAVSIDQISLQAKGAIAIRAHVADTTTDDDGRFGGADGVDVGKFNGLFLLTAKGGAFTDLATGATVELDSTTTLETITSFELFDTRDDVLVSPVGQLIAARTRWKLSQLGDVRTAELDAAEHLNRHFAGVVDWSHQKLGSLETTTTSPTEAVRSALVQAALSFLAQDIAAAAGASPQEVNVLTLTRQLAADLGQGTFDGNDGNAPTFGEGLQVGVCPPITGSCPMPAGSCTLGACRPLCDLYAGTPRALLAGEMTKVIQSTALNHTGLVTGDVLAVARAMADNVDEDLFGSACVENLDRLPPRLEWIEPVPGPGIVHYVRGMVPVKAHAVDDTDPMPLVWIDNGAPSSSTAGAVIDTTAQNGPLMVTATARDMAGNLATLALPGVIADNVAPTLTLASDGYFVDGATWWTTSPAPVLRGTVADASPLTVATIAPAGTVNATVTGSTWTGSLAGTLDLAGADVTVAATDAAGNRTQVTQRLRADVTPPQLTFQPSVVNDEAVEVPAFDANEAPVHVHTGAAIDLAAAGSCPAVTKFSYLLGASRPPYGREVDGQGGPRPNPLHYLLLAADDGVGITPGSTQYRVGYRTNNVTTWILDWTTAGAPTPILGVDQYDIGIFSDAIPQLMTTEGVYDVEFRATDRLARTTTLARCFELHLRAPPLHLQAPGGSPTDPDPIPVDHAYRLQSLALGAGAFRAIAARLLNNDATGASLLDEDVTNGTASTVYLQVAVTRPQTVLASQTFTLRNLTTTSTANIDCTEGPGIVPPAICEGPATGPSYTSSPSNVSITSLGFPVKVFELDGSGQPATEVPCLVCGIADQWKFAIPPRPGSASGPLPARRFKAMTMIGQVSALWPSDASFPASPPFVDAALTSTVNITGRISPTSTGCTAHTIRILPNGTELDKCTQVTSITPYRALTQVSINTDPVKATYATAPTSSSTPANVVGNKIPELSWSVSEGALP